jgi:hypothetical protein
VTSRNRETIKFNIAQRMTAARPEQPPLASERSGLQTRFAAMINVSLCAQMNCNHSAMAGFAA